MVCLLLVSGRSSYGEMRKAAESEVGAEAAVAG